MNITETNAMTLPLSKLKSNTGQIEGVPANPRTLRDDKYKALVKSLQTNNLTGVLPLKVYQHNGEYIVLGGNQRLHALKDIGAKQVACIEIPQDTPAEVLREIVIQDNSTYGDWDFDMLANEWDAQELADWGVDVPVFADEEPTAQEDDFDEDKEEISPVCQKGDIWKLGKHRLMCGDSTSADDVAKLMDGEIADISFSSPPYNAGFGKCITKDNGRSKYTNGSDDDLSRKEYADFLIAYLNNAQMYAKYAFCNIQMLANNKLAILDMINANVSTFGEIVVWDKARAQPAAADRVLNSQFEFVFVFHKDATRAIGTKHFHGTLSNIVTITTGRNEYSEIHNAVFPIALPEHFIANFSTDSVLDLFGGTGTTLIAAEQLNRRCYMMELDQHYCDVIIARWEKLTGQKAERL